MSLTLRPYSEVDLERLHTIDQACYPPRIAYSKRTLQWFLRRRGAHCVVAETEGQIVGFILAEHRHDMAHLITLDVLEPHRRRGVGTALVDTIENTMARWGARRIELETATDNHAAIAFWRSRGYRTVGVLKRYYPGWLDAYAMHKPLEVPKEN